MQKKSILLTLNLFLISFVSAQYFSGYNRFSFPDLLRSIDPQTMILGAIFIISFVLIFWPLSRVFRGSYGQPNKIIPFVLALTSASIITYWINRYDFGIENFLYGVGLSSDLLYIIFGIIILIGIIFFVRKFSLATFFFFGGLVLIGVTFLTEFFYEKGLVATIGLIMVLIGIIWWWKRRGRNTAAGRGAVAAGRYIGSKYDPEKQRRQTAAIKGGIKKGWAGTFARGRGMSRRRAEKQAYKEEAKRQKIQQRPQRELEEAERQAYKEEVRRQKIQQKQVINQQKVAGKTQKEREKDEEQAYKEEARRQEAQQKQIIDQQRAAEKAQRDKVNAEENAYKEEARRQRRQQEEINKAEGYAYKEEFRRSKIEKRNLKREYDMLAQQNAAIFDRNRGIPPKGTVEGDQRSQNIGRMKEIERLIKIKPLKPKSRKKGWFR